MELPRERLYAWCSASEQAGDDPLQPQQSLAVVLEALGLLAPADDRDDALSDFAAALMALVRRETQPFAGLASAGALAARPLATEAVAPAPPPPPQTPPRPAAVLAPPPYEDAFPALGMSAAPKAQPKAKKRVRATLIAAPSGSSSSGGNIASLPSGDSLAAMRPAMPAAMPTSASVPNPAFAAAAAPNPASAANSAFAAATAPNPAFAAAATAPPTASTAPLKGSSSNGGGSNGVDKACAPGCEATGRWTKQEHEMFLKALRKFGKEWKKVAAMVKTRTVVQTRTHAQKYFQKLQKLQQTGEVRAQYKKKE